MSENLNKISKAEHERTGSASHWKRGKYRKEAEKSYAESEAFHKAHPFNGKVRRSSKESRIRLSQVAAKERAIDKSKTKHKASRKRTSVK